MLKPKTVDEWEGLNKKEKDLVKFYLKDWLELFKEQADGNEGNVHRADFVNNDFFFYTDCRDILAKDPMATGIEPNDRIRDRKRKVLLQLFVKTLLGEEVGRKTSCSHCGYDDTRYDSYSGGSFSFCPKCGLTTVNTYPDQYKTVMDEIAKKILQFPSPYFKKTKDLMDAVQKEHKK